MASANGRFFEGGFSGTSNTKSGAVRDYISESISNIKKQADLLQSIQFQCCTYDKTAIPTESIIYCDPPYKGTKKYSGEPISHDHFYQWCRTQRNNGHTVFVSEYEMPSDFKCVWQKEIKSSLSANGVTGGSKNSIERLFTL